MHYPSGFAARAGRALMISLFALAVFAGGRAFAQEAAADAVVATVDGTDITEADVAAAIADLGHALADRSPQEVRSQVITYLIDLQLMAAKARQAGLDKTDAFRSRTAYFENKALLELHLNDVSKKATSDEAAKKLYDDLVGKVEPETEVRARHILVESEEAAKDIRKQLDDGADFAELAKEKSSDPESGAAGGDLGFFTKDSMLPEFAEAAFSMQPGEISDPVRSQVGWHVIKVEETRPKAPPAFDDVKAQLLDMVGQQAQRDEVMGAREKAKVERSDQPEGGAEDAEETEGGAE